jgi:hypothetical protein
MPDPNAALRERFKAADWAIFAAGPLVWALLAVWVGQETSWDFRNYHWYNAYAFETGRYALDVAPAHAATYYNPALDIGYRFFALSLPPILLLALLGAVQGFNFSLLFLIARSVLTAEEKFARIAAAAIAAAGIAGGMSLRIIGTTYYDNVLSLLALAALYGLLRADRRMEATPRFWLPPLLLAGYSVGAAVGMKLVEMPYGIAFAATLLLLAWSLKQAAVLVAASGLAAMLGVAMFGGFWFLHLAHVTGNPLFPFFTDIFPSGLLSSVDQRDARFVPHGIVEALGFPFLLSWDWHNAADWKYGDARLAIAYVAVPLALLASLRLGRAKEPWVAPRDVALILFFVAVSYLSWMLLFGIYRYAVALEMLAPLAVVAALGLVGTSQKLRLAVGCLLLALALATTSYQFGPRVRPGGELVALQLPTLADPEHTIVLMTGAEPMAYVIPSFPPEVSFLRVDGYLARYDDNSGLSRDMDARIAAHRGPHFVLYRDLARTEKVMNYLKLKRIPGECTGIASNIGPALQFCPVEPLPK